MAYHYVGGDRDQLFLLPVSMRDWLEEGHLAWFVLDVVARVDTSALHARHPNDGAGRPAYDPDMMLALLLYAYGTGLRSSRRVEAACRTDAAFRVITGGVAPDHATIARFLANHESAIEGLFVDVLGLCAAAGLVSVDVVAIDGTKMGADAALDANRTRAAIDVELERLRGEVAAILAQARAADAADDADEGLFGLAALFDRDRLPAALATRAAREARLEQAAAVVDAHDAAARAATQQRAAKAQAAAGAGRQLAGRKPKDPHAALASAEVDLDIVTERVEAARAARAASRQAKLDQAAAGRSPGHLPSAALRSREQQQLDAATRRLAAARQAAQATAPTAAKANTTDPDSRIMKAAAGWVQGFNAQAAVTQDHIIVACTVSQHAADVGLYQPMVAAARATLDAAGVDEAIGLVLGDAGYWSDDNATADGPDRLIATLKDHKQRRAARELGTTTGPPPPDATPLEAMEHRLRTQDGAAAYATRSHTVEPVFAVKANHGYQRFRRRGLQAAASEWALMSTVHNLGKLHRAS